MDVLSHGLWGGVSFFLKSEKRFWLAFGFGMAPDIFSFGIFMGLSILGLVSGPDWSMVPPDITLIPNYVHVLYSITHSLFVFVFAFGLVWFWRKKPLYEMLAWPLHIFMDIPTHSTSFFATPFLWPISSYRLDGIPWSHPIILFGNAFLLLTIYGGLLYRRKKKMITRNTKDFER